MSYIPDELIEEIRVRNDIVDVIGSCVKITRKGASYQGLCPFHSEKTPSFSVSPSKQLFKCFGCGVGGNVISFVERYENYSFIEAVKFLAERAGVALPEAEYSQEAKAKEAHRTRLLEVNRDAAAYFYYQLRHKQGEVGFKYLRERGLSEETINKFGLGFSNMNSNDLVKYLESKGYEDELIKEAGLATFNEKYGMSDLFWNRVMFPIQDVNHRVIGFGGRVMSDAKPKYLNSPESPVFDKGRNLFGLNLARTARKNRFILCEGYMDVISLHQAGFNEAVASLGTAFTSGQASILSRYADMVYLAYDSDGAGVTAALRNMKILRDAGIPSKVISMEPCKDPDEFIKTFGPEKFEERIQNAENSFFFEIRKLSESVNQRDPDERTKFVKEIGNRLANFPDEVERETYLAAICEKYSINVDTMKRTVATVAAKAGGFDVPQRPKSTNFKEKDPDEGIKEKQRSLLTWLVEEPEIYKKIKDLITPEDFTGDIYKIVAKRVFEEIENGNLNPGAIVNLFEEDEQQSEVAAIFLTEQVAIDDKAKREQSLKDYVVAIKQKGIENSESGWTIKARREFEEFKKKIKFTID